jgi:hypothetical protein
MAVLEMIYINDSMSALCVHWWLTKFAAQEAGCPFIQVISGMR